MPDDTKGGLARVAAKERNNHMQGRTGAATRKISGPAAGSRGHANPVRGGGINRATKGMR